MRIYVGKNIATIKTEKGRLVYPLNMHFIKELSKRQADKWRAAGWDIEKTVFLELKYPTIPIDSETPSLLFAGISHLWDRGVYIRVVTFSRGYFDSVDEINMSIDTFHEKLHLLSSEQQMYEGGEALTEEDIVKMEIMHVLQKYGEKGIIKRKEHLIKFFKALENVKAIRGELAILCIWEYLTANYKKYERQAIKIPASYNSPKQQEPYRKVWLQYYQLYSILLKRDIEELLPNITKWFSRKRTRN
ncbi:MAG: hypothetical protein J7J67_01955 [Thermoproteales archaeon]|nr:hypothetical protein [Thermoproteales archaeon]